MYDNTHIRPFYQPLVAIDSGLIMAYEVLGRMVVNDQVLSLGPFFHDASIDAGQKLRIDRLVRFQALHRLQQSDVQPLLFINIQAGWLTPYLDNGDTLPTLSGMDRHDVPGDRIVIEICEDFCGEVERLREIVSVYRRAGCRIAIDDVGSSFSNMERVALLKPDFIKVGTSFIEKGIARNGVHLLKSLGQFCEMAGISLVLEEVENADHLLMGIENGVRYFQGYYFSPARADFQDEGSFVTLLNQGRQKYYDRKIKRFVSQRASEGAYNTYIERRLPQQVGNGAVEQFLEGDIYGLLLDFAPQEWHRVYICRITGEQVSPNYIRTDGGRWREYPEYKGRNWCWRPYFVDRVREAIRLNRGSLSDPYRDLETDRQIATFAYPIGSDVFMFVDVEDSAANEMKL